MPEDGAAAPTTAIESGDLAPGGKLPSETELVSRYGVAGGTVRQAVGVLRGEDVVVADGSAGLLSSQASSGDKPVAAA